MVRIANSIVKSPNAIHMRDSIGVILFPRFQVSLPNTLVHYIFSLLTLFLEVPACKPEVNCSRVKYRWLYVWAYWYASVKYFYLNFYW